MKIMELDIPVGLGDMIHTRGMLDDAVKHYDKINLGLAFNLLDKHRPHNKDKNILFLSNLAKLIFNNKKVNLHFGNKYGLVTTDKIPGKYKINFLLPNLKNELTFPKKEIDGEYIVITTKIRDLTKKSFLEKKNSFVRAISDLSKKYKIVILGEKKVEIGNGIGYGSGSGHIYGIYDVILEAVESSKNYLDLTVPALGITVPTLSNVQKDCTIMKFAKNVITLGSGGNFSLAMSVANTSCYREDRLNFIKSWYDKQVNNNFYLTTNWDAFLKRIASL
jgi:hypothetical protein